MKMLRGSIAPGLMVIAVATATAQSPRPMTIIDLIDVPQLNGPQLSPTGSQVLYTLGQADWKANKRVSHVWRVNTDGSGAVQLTNGAEGESDAHWSPDGSQIAFVAKRGDGAESQIYLIPNSGGEARKLTDHATSVSDITWSADGSTLYFLAPEAKTAEQKERDKLKDD